MKRPTTKKVLKELEEARDVFYYMYKTAVLHYINAPTPQKAEEVKKELEKAQSVCSKGLFFFSAMSYGEKGTPLWLKDDDDD